MPSTVPQILYPPGGPRSQPEGTDLIQIGFLYPLNYDFVCTHEESQRQIFKYLPIGISHGLAIGIENCTMQAIRAYDTAHTSQYITTLALAWIPKNLVKSLADAIFYHYVTFYDNPDPTVKKLLSQINPFIAILPFNTSGGKNSFAFGSTGVQVSSLPSAVTQAVSSLLLDPSTTSNALLSQSTDALSSRATTTQNLSPSSSSPPIVQSLPSSTIENSTKSSEIAISAAAGASIGIGALVAALAVLALVFFFFFFYRRRNIRALKQSPFPNRLAQEEGNSSSSNDVSGVRVQRHFAEEEHAAITELDNDGGGPWSRRKELDGKSRAEMEHTSRAELEGRVSSVELPDGGGRLEMRCSNGTAKSITISRSFSTRSA